MHHLDWLMSISCSWSFSVACCSPSTSPCLLRKSRVTSSSCGRAPSRHWARRWPSLEGIQRFNAITRILVSRVMIAVCVPFEFWIVYGLHRRYVFNKKVWLETDVKLTASVINVLNKKVWLETDVKLTASVINVLNKKVWLETHVKLTASVINVSNKKVWLETHVKLTASVINVQMFVVSIKCKVAPIIYNNLRAEAKTGFERSVVSMKWPE